MFITYIQLVYTERITCVYYTIFYIVLYLGTNINTGKISYIYLKIAIFYYTCIVHSVYIVIVNTSTFFFIHLLISYRYIRNLNINIMTYVYVIRNNVYFVFIVLILYTIKLQYTIVYEQHDK